ncbi:MULTISPECIES: hypothetical protein [Spirulina sp. CCY15215]|uniref:hypothetical protein n=1 Tax=Spirulina sp. CCY15215 TaxID=2767591 RepID=UPI001952430B|nr:hypothetical protein [Spirulina major]
MKLNEIVRINESGMVANAVNFGMMDDNDKNLRLCQGFIFNYKNLQPKSSTLGVLDTIRNSYHSQNQSNIHLFVQDYGKGKSHFALVAANYFKQGLGSEEVKGILNQVKIASGNNQGILEDLTAYKRRNQKHLVICINGGSSETDLRKIFLRSLRQILEVEGITDSLAQQFCQKPLDYLNTLTEEQIKSANDFLEENNHQKDVNSIIDSLEKDQYKVISIVKEISGELNKGFTIDFETDLSIEKIIEELINNLCSGEDKKYSGILILFDELNAYLQAWATDPFNSGGLTLQSITDACENNKGKIALVCFTQIKPLKSVPSQSIEDYKKLATRLEITESIYEPVSSLELVIQGLLDQQFNPESWKKFRMIWDNALLGDSRIAHEKRIKIYQERGWNLAEFNNNITLGCFPLHPLNSYLLCNLDFTQGRTAIQYIKEDVKKFISSQLVEKNSRLNYLPAISLVDAFESNFSQLEFSRHYLEYKKAYDTISASATEGEISVLKGLFLYYASQNKLHKTESEKHDVILSELTGLSEKETKNILEKLAQQEQVIYFNTGNNTYRFYSGSNLLEVRQEIEEEASKQTGEISINLAIKHCNEKIEIYLGSKNINGQHFIDKNQLLNDEWFFEYKFYGVEEFKQALNGYKTLENIEGKGIFAYVLADNIDELQALRYEINDLLLKERNKDYIAVAIPDNHVKDICKDLLMIDIMRRKSTVEKQDSGTAFAELNKQILKKVEREIKQIITPNNCDFYFIKPEELTTHQKQNPQSIVSHLLQQLYRFVPPLAKNDKMALKSHAGNTIIGYAANLLLEDDHDLNPKKFRNQSYNTLIDQVFVSNWGLFKTDSQKYSVQVPINKNVREAWDKIEQLTALENKTKKCVPISKIWQELSKPPFGYNEYTFTMLFSAWIADHSSEVILKGSFGLPKKKNAPSIEEKPIKDWAETGVFGKPKDFVNKWILGSNTSPQLIRTKAITCPKIPTRLDYNQAKKLVEEIDNFIKSADPDQAKVEEITPKRKQLSAEIKKIDDWFKSVEETETLFSNKDNIDIEILISVYPRLQQTLSKIIDLAHTNRSKNIIVTPTKKQEERRTDALEKVQENIKKIVIQLSKKSESLKTEEEYGGYKVELQTTIDKITSVSLPDHLIQTLNYSLDVATRKLDEIKYQAEIKDCLDKIKLLHNSLSNNASQEDYIKAISDIEKLANQIEIVKQESLYQEIIEDIQTKQNDLEKKITIWNEKLIDINKNEAFKLYKEISNQQNRFTKSESSREVKQILDQLNPIILEIQDAEEAENIKHQRDNEIIQQLRQNNSESLNTLKLCQEGIAKITQLKTQLNLPERFKTEIEELINSLNNKITDYGKQLEELTEKLTEVKSNQELKPIPTNLGKLELFFKDSDEYLTCQQLQQEIEDLRELFQITQGQKFNTTIDTYQDQLKQLTEWYNNLDNCTPNLDNKYEQNKSQLEQRITALETKFQNQAQLWLDNLRQELSKIEQETEDKKLNLINELLKKIKNNQAVHISYLSNSDQELLGTIKTQCTNIQNENQENQIITLFTQLPTERRQNLYSELEQYLSKEEKINE